MTTATIAKLDWFTIGGCRIAFTYKHEYRIIPENGAYTFEVLHRIREVGDAPVLIREGITKNAAVGLAEMHASN